jgi:precorrin-2 dehydrogenase/sirohydrochlorin ferrochelatase
MVLMGGRGGVSVPVTIVVAVAVVPEVGVVAIVVVVMVIVVVVVIGAADDHDREQECGKQKQVAKGHVELLVRDAARVFRAGGRPQMFPIPSDTTCVPEASGLGGCGRKWKGGAGFATIWPVVSYRYPILLDVSACLAVVVGGGAVGVRKVGGLIEAGAGRVRVVAPDFHPDMPTAGVERVAGRYDAQHLDGARLVFAATDSAEVNDAVVRDARRIGAWVNRADVDEELAGDFTVPAQLRQGPVLVTVSAGGSPAIAANVRDELKAHVDERWGRLAEAMQDLRPRIRRAGQLDSTRRRSLLKELSSAEALEVIGGAGDDAAQSLWRWAAARYPELERLEL